MSLIELLVATVVAAVVLAGAFGWLAGVTTAASRAQRRADASGAAAAAVRAVARDARLAVAVAPPPSGRPIAATLHLSLDAPGVAPDESVIVYDAARKVLWRNAPGSYLADHVTSFAIRYILLSGESVSPTEMAAADWAEACGVRITVAVVAGDATAELSAELPLGAA